MTLRHYRTGNRLLLQGRYLKKSFALCTLCSTSDNDCSKYKYITFSIYVAKQKLQLPNKFVESYFENVFNRTSYLIEHHI